MHRLLLVPSAIIIACALGCADGKPESNPGSPPSNAGGSGSGTGTGGGSSSGGTSLPQVAGTWSGTFTEPSHAWAISMTIVQTGGTLTGTYLWTDDQPPVQGTLQGAVSTGSIAMTLTDTKDHFTYTVRLIPGSGAMNGSFSCIGVANGSVQLLKSAAN